MRIEKDSVVFDPEDMFFVRRFGVTEAAEIVLRHDKKHVTPFVYDTHQLAFLLGVPHEVLTDLIQDIPSHYRYTSIPKRSGGARRICEPLSPLNTVQRSILRRILYCSGPSLYATAYSPGSHLEFNAYPHVRKRRLLKMDITDFFGSITADMVRGAVFDCDSFPEEIGAILTDLCCLDGVLPQGACTSPALSNLVMFEFDTLFGDWCKERFISYTRYCDDITVSGFDSLYPAYCKAKELLGKMGFTLNEKKTRFITNASRQTVTGLTVNEKVSVPADYKRRLRQELYYVTKYGIADVIGRQKLTEYTGEGGCGRYYANLMGRLNFVLDIEPHNKYFLSARIKLMQSKNK